MERLELEKLARGQAIGSLQRYFEENLDRELGEMPAGLLLDFFLEEVGPVIYNRAIADAQTRMTTRVEDLGGELHEAEFGYWARMDARRKARK